MHKLEVCKRNEEVTAASNPVERAYHAIWACSQPWLKRLTGPAIADNGEKIAIVGFGPSLHETWKELESFKYILSTSGAHKFLLDRGIVPTHHLDIDPRAYKAALMGDPHPGVRYFIGASCHSQYFQRLKDYDVTLLQHLSHRELLARVAARGEWALTGGPCVGTRAMLLARYLGFREQHLFGLDWHTQTDKSHAGAHPNAVKADCELEIEGRTYLTTRVWHNSALSAVNTVHNFEDTQFIVHGDSLLTALLRVVPRSPTAGGIRVFAFSKDELLSPEYKRQLALLREREPFIGPQWRDEERASHSGRVKDLMPALDLKTVLEIRIGVSPLEMDLDFPIWSFDVSREGYQPDPPSADLVVCTEVLERIEPDKLQGFLRFLDAETRKVCYVSVYLVPSADKLDDGRELHLTVADAEWWRKTLSRYFEILADWDLEGIQYHALLGGKQWIAESSSVTTAESQSPTASQPTPSFDGPAAQ